MIAVSVLYPQQPGSRFDMTYYCGHHMPLLRQRLGAALLGDTVEQGLGGPAPGAPAPFVAGCRLLFDSLESFQGAFAPHAAEIMADVPRYTDRAPLVQVAQVLA